MRNYIEEMEWRDRLVVGFGKVMAAVIVQEADRLSYTTVISREEARWAAEQNVQAEINRRARGDL